MPLNDIISCHLVNHHWFELSNENIIYRDLFHRYQFKISPDIKDTPPPSPAYTTPNLSRSNSMNGPTLSRSNSTSKRQQFANAIALNSNFNPFSSTITPINNISTPIINSNDPIPSPLLSKTLDAPLSLDWLTLFKQRLELERRWHGKGEPKVNFLQSHSDSVYCVSFNEEILISGSRDKSIKIWNLNTLTLLNTIENAHNGSVINLKFKKNFLVSVGSDCLLKIWKLGYGKHLGKIKLIQSKHDHLLGVLDVDFNNNFVCTCSKDSNIKIYDRKSLKLLTTINQSHSSPVNSISLTKQDLLASGGGDKLLKIWQLSSNINEIKLINTIDKSHSRGIACVDIDHNLIATGSNDNKISLNDINGKNIGMLIGHKSLVRSLQLDFNRQLLVSGSYDKCVKIWNLNNFELYRQLENFHSSLILDLKFDCRRIVSASHDKRIMIVDFSYDLNESNIFA